MLLLWLALGLQPVRAQAPGVQLSNLAISRVEGGLNLDFAARITLSNAAQEALARGVPMYFVAEATLVRSRWYWRDERVARVSRVWRVAFQPLTSTWRVSLAGLNQTFSSLPEALVFASRAAGWRLAEQGQLDPDRAYHVQFSYRLDTSQLPGPIQFGLAGGEWALGVSRELKVEP